MYFHKLACGINYPIVYRNTTRGTTFYQFLQKYDHIAFANLYGLMVYFTTFCIIFNILHIVMIGGGAMW